VHDANEDVEYQRYISHYKHCMIKEV